MEECVNQRAIEHAAENIVDYFTEPPVHATWSNGSPTNNLPLIDLKHIHIPNDEFVDEAWNGDGGVNYYDGISEEKSSVTKGVSKELMVKLVRLHLERWI